MCETPEGDGEHLKCHSSEITGFCDYHWPVVIIQCGCATVKKMQRYFKCLYTHGISLSSSRPPWSPIPPAARRTPEPASRSLPSPFDQVSPGDVEMNSYWRKTSWVKTSLHIPLPPDRTWMFLELTWWKCFCWWVKPGENPRGQNVKIPFYLHQEKLDCNVITQLDKVVQNNCNLCFVHLHLHQWVWQ